jgi:membrane protein
MAGDAMAKWRRLRAAARDFFLEHDIAANVDYTHSRLHRFAHFWLLVGKSFNRNRCPVRAASLAYTTLLALVPLLAVGMSITTAMLQKQGDKPAEELIGKLVNYVAPALDLQARPLWADALPMDEEEAAFFGITNANYFAGSTNSLSDTNSSSSGGTNAPAFSGRERVVKQITGFIGNIRTGRLTTVGVLALLFIGISLLRTIEATFNDIWGVANGRGWFKSIVYYWTTITLGPLVLVGTITLTTSPKLEASRAWLDHVPWLGATVVHVLPFVILSLGFAAFYALIPNTKVHFRAALVGGIIGGSLWQLNNLLSVLYVSQVMSYTNIYGSLGIFPLFLIGMYFSWLIMLFGAQVAYAWQNRESYVQEKLSETVNQRGREFVALRMMTHIARNFLAGARPLSVVELSQQLTVPGQLAQRLLSVLVKHGLLVEAMENGEARYSPGRPLERISAYEVVNALRGSGGQELATTEDESRALVRAEFDRMTLAERNAAAGVTMQSLAELTAKQIGDTTRPALVKPEE